MELCQDKRGTFINMEYITTERARLEYELPLSEILMDFFDRLKSRTKVMPLWITRLLAIVSLI